MQIITPYKTLPDALATLDNGGRFYNIFTNEKDGKIDSSELARVAGVFSDRQRMFLYLDTALCHLPAEEAAEVIGALSGRLRKQYENQKPIPITPAELDRVGRAGISAMVSGVPQFVESNAVANGFVMMPVTMGKTTNLVMIPLTERYKVYEIRDEKTDNAILIAHDHSQEKLPARPMLFGGILKELKGDKTHTPRHSLFLEAIYGAEV